MFIGWRKLTDGEKANIGILTYSCGSNNSTTLNFNSCKDYWNSRPGWEKAVIVLMFVALALELIIIAWSLISCCLFCFPACFSLVTILSAIATVCLIVAVSLYGGKNAESIGKTTSFVFE
jgi:hypothetical protein